MVVLPAGAAVPRLGLDYHRGTKNPMTYNAASSKKQKLIFKRLQTSLCRTGLLATLDFDEAFRCHHIHRAMQLHRDLFNNFMQTIACQPA
eukprot:4087638-Amphidinium_carterae.2